MTIIHISLKSLHLSSIQAPNSPLVIVTLTGLSIMRRSWYPFCLTFLSVWKIVQYYDIVYISKTVINNKTLTKFLILSMRLLFRILLNTINVREQKMDNSEKLATLGTQDTGRRPLKQKHTTVRKQTQTTSIRHEFKYGSSMFTFI